MISLQSKTDIATLRWLLCSPPLLAHAQSQSFSTSELAAIEAWLVELNDNSAALDTWLAHARANCGAQPLRIGRLAERLLEFFLRHGPLHRLVACNVPVRKTTPTQDHTTAGELDFLLTSPQGEHQHWELAVKYFLCHANGPVAYPKDFIGPDAAETFERKLHKLFEQQLQHPVPAPHTLHAWKHLAYARGWMFYRLGQPVPSCAVLNPLHLRGTWLPLAELHQLNPQNRYVELARSQWMPRLAEQNADETLSLNELGPALSAAWASQTDPAAPRSTIQRIAKAQTAASKPGARLVAQLAFNANDGLWHECARHFVLPG